MSAEVHQPSCPAEASGFIGNLSDEHLQALAALRSGPLQASLGSPRWTDAQLLRHLRHSHFNLEATTKALEGTLKYREDRGLDRCADRFPWGPDDPYKIRSNLADIKQYYPHGFHKTDRQGGPVYVERLGCLDPGNLMQVIDPDELVQYFAEESERQASLRLPASSLAHGRLVQTAIAVLDMEGLSWRVVMNGALTRVVRAVLAEQDQHFPSITTRLVIVNAPAVFSIFWAAISGMMSAQALATIEVHRSGSPSVQQRLFELIAPENLPDFLGGTCRCQCPGGCLYSDAGPWSDAQHLETLRKTPPWEVMQHLSEELDPRLAQLRVQLQLKAGLPALSSPSVPSSSSSSSSPLLPSTASLPPWAPPIGAGPTSPGPRSSLPWSLESSQQELTVSAGMQGPAPEASEGRESRKERSSKDEEEEKEKAEAKKKEAEQQSATAPNNVDRKSLLASAQDQADQIVGSKSPTSSASTATVIDGSAAVVETIASLWSDLPGPDSPAHRTSTAEPPALARSPSPIQERSDAPADDSLEDWLEDDDEDDDDANREHGKGEEQWEVATAAPEVGLGRPTTTAAPTAAPPRATPTPTATVASAATAAAKEASAATVAATVAATAAAKEASATAPTTTATTPAPTVTPPTNDSPNLTTTEFEAPSAPSCVEAQMARQSLSSDPGQVLAEHAHWFEASTSKLEKSPLAALPPSASAAPSAGAGEQQDAALDEASEKSSDGDENERSDAGSGDDDKNDNDAASDDNPRPSLSIADMFSAAFLYGFCGSRPSKSDPLQGQPGNLPLLIAGARPPTDEGQVETVQPVQPN